jgi:hypothetical protein
LTCPVSVHLNVETTFYLHEQSVGYWPSSSPRLIWADHTSSGRRQNRRRPVRRRGTSGADGECDRGHRRSCVPIQLGEPLASWVLDPDLDKHRRMDPRAIVGAAVDTIAGGVPDEIRADYLACYEGDRFAESMRYVRRYPEELPALAQLLPQIATPGHDHQRPPRPSRSRSSTLSFSTSGCPPAAS